MVKRGRSTTKNCAAVKRRKVGPSRKRRNVKRAKINSARKITLPRFGFLPPKVVCRLRKEFVPFSITTDALGVSQQNTSLDVNKVYNATATLQPSEYYELISMYEKCHVIGAKLTVTCLPTASTANIDLKWGLYMPKFGEAAGDSALSVSDKTYQFMKSNNRIWKNVRSVPFAYQNKPAGISLVKKWSAKKWSGRSDYIDDTNEDLTYSTIAANADAQFLPAMSVWLVGQAGAASNAVNFNATVEYICVFSDKKTTAVIEANIVPT